MMKPEAGFKPYLIIRRGQAEDAQLLAELGARTFSETLLRRTRLKNMAAYLASAFSLEQTRRAELADPDCSFKLRKLKESPLVTP